MPPAVASGAGASSWSEARYRTDLAVPAQIVCREDCAGLCQVCGEDLNANPHEHERPPDPRFAKLSELRFE
jgi:uncharacterized protein